MRMNKVYLNQLNVSSRNYKVKVRVIEKGRPKCSSKKGTPYQNLLLEDEQGTKMRGILFGEQVEGYKEVLMYNGEYEIANAPIKLCADQWKVSATDLDFQMHFGKPAIVERVADDNSPLLPQYRGIAQIPKTADPNDKYDIAAVVLFVEEKPRRIVRDQDRVIAVREIVVIDHSTEHPLVISAWNDLAEDECDLLIPKAEQLKVVGFTALKVSPHKGFSLTTTMSTTIQHSPVGDRPRALEDWAASHNAKLCAIQARILTLKGLFGQNQTTTIATLRMKKAQTTLQDERYTLQVTIPEPDFQKINAYLGCSKCNKRTDISAGNSFTCPHCSKSGCKSIPRITYNCDVSDGTGTLPITAFTTDAEKILCSVAPDIFRMKHSEDLAAFEAVKTQLQTTPFTIEVGPNTTLSMNNVLHWVLKRIVDTTESPPSSPPTDTQAPEMPGPNIAVPVSDVPVNLPTATDLTEDCTTNTATATAADKKKTVDMPETASPTIQEPKLMSVKIEGSKLTTAKKRKQNTTPYPQKDELVTQNADT